VVVRLVADQALDDFNSAHTGIIQILASNYWNKFRTVFLLMAKLLAEVALGESGQP
jgi:hypothetical protein